MTIEEIKQINFTERPTFASFAQGDLPLCGLKRCLSDILNKRLLVTDYRISKSKHREGEYLELQVLLEGEVYIIFTGSTVLLKQIRTASDKIPFLTTIVKVDKYYSFS